MSGADAPEGYERGARGDARWIVLADAARWIEDTLRSDRTLRGWAERVRGGTASGGRGTVSFAPAPLSGPDARTEWAVRRYRRGGGVAVLGDRYLGLGATRPAIETRASAAARARGVRTPAVIAGAWYASGAIYRADLVTERIPDAITLAQALFAPSPTGQERTLLLESAGRLARELGERGLRHADLNAHNVLVVPGAVDRPWVVDLDRADPDVEPGTAQGLAMLARLERSLAKIGASCGRPLSATEASALRDAFEEAP